MTGFDIALPTGILASISVALYSINHQLLIIVKYLKSKP
jgi:hypothetical protein